ncbi:unnamed protein product, partial [Musa acuminata subsp. burmannicoides]
SLCSHQTNDYHKIISLHEFNLTFQNPIHEGSFILHKIHRFRFIVTFHKMQSISYSKYTYANKDRPKIF